MGDGYEFNTSIMPAVVKPAQLPATAYILLLHSTARTQHEHNKNTTLRFTHSTRLAHYRITARVFEAVATTPATSSPTETQTVTYGLLACVIQVQLAIVIWECQHGIIGQDLP